jgi:hypothetical protein
MPRKEIVKKVPVRIKYHYQVPVFAKSMLYGTSPCKHWKAKYIPKGNNTKCKTIARKL